MTLPVTDHAAGQSAVRCDGVVKANTPVSSGLVQLDLELDRPVSFLPGQFAMLNLAGQRAFVFSRPFSILAAAERHVSFLYRMVGQGTRAMGDLGRGESMTFLGPLGRPYPIPAADQAIVLIAGGVGLPPVAAWLARQGPESAVDIQAFFGARDGADVPWDLLDDRWNVSVDCRLEMPPGRQAWEGLVTDLVADRDELRDGRARTVLACGPTPLLKAAARLAAARDWTCWLSLEEHMGCGYGVCKGCVVPVRDQTGGPAAVRNATCCEEGPVFNAVDLVWAGGGHPGPDCGAPATMED